MSTNKITKNTNHANMNLTIREARETDWETLLEFEQGVIEYERPFNSAIGKENVTYYNLQEMLHSENYRLVVAENDNEVIASGYGKIAEAEPFIKYHKYGYLGFIYVKPAFRGQGISRLVMDHLALWLKEQGAEELRLDVYYDNLSAIKAYHKYGFKESLVKMRMPL